MIVSEEVVLGIERSLTGKRWEASASDDRIVRAFGQRLGLSDIVSRILSARGVKLDDAEAFLHPSLRTLLPDPSMLSDMDVAVSRIAAAIKAGETIGVFGDYDVDGATSAALLHVLLELLVDISKFMSPTELAKAMGQIYRHYLALVRKAFGSL